MKKRAPRSADSASRIPVAGLRNLARAWLTAGDVDNHSDRILERRQMVVDKLLWLMQQKEYSFCGHDELVEWMQYLRRGHERPGGRWGNPLLTKPLAPRSIETYHGDLQAMFNWLVENEFITSSPMDRIPSPIARKTKKQPFTEEQMRALELATRKQDKSGGRHHGSVYPLRDYALLLFAEDTGLRSSEIADLKWADVSLTDRTVLVRHGKGDKERTVAFSRKTLLALQRYVAQVQRADDDPLFFSSRQDHFTRWGLYQLMRRLCARAGIKQPHSGVHRLRHTFAVEYLRAGGDQFSLMELLGHEDTDMTNEYVALAGADVIRKHRQFSPVDHRKRKRG